MKENNRVILDDQLSRRSRHHKNIIEIQGQSILEFNGETIPGVIRVSSKDYTQNGKRSYYTWVCYLEPECKVIILTESWGTGQWIVSQTWEAVTDELKERGFLAPARIIIEKLFPKKAKLFDEEDAFWARYTSKEILDLLKEEAQLRTEEQSLLAEAKKQGEIIALIRSNANRRKRLDSLKGQKLSFNELKKQLGY